MIYTLEQYQTHNIVKCNIDKQIPCTLLIIMSIYNVHIHIWTVCNPITIVQYTIKTKLHYIDASWITMKTLYSAGTNHYTFSGGSTIWWLKNIFFRVFQTPIINFLHSKAAVTRWYDDNYILERLWVMVLLKTPNIGDHLPETPFLDPPPIHWANACTQTINKLQTIPWTQN